MPPSKRNHKHKLSVFLYVANNPESNPNLVYPPIFPILHDYQTKTKKKFAETSTAAPQYTEGERFKTKIKEFGRKIKAYYFSRGLFG
jgi:hypothetical protein